MIEKIADDILIQYQHAIGESLTPPVRAASILDMVFDGELHPLLWEAISEPAGCTILGGLAANDRVIVLNEQRRDLLIDTPGLLNDTLGHELGHWMLHVDRDMLGHPHLPGTPLSPGFSCEAADSQLDAGYRTWDERNAHRFMASLLMPGSLLRPAALSTDLRSWPGLYQLRDVFQVSITAMRIRLEELHLVYIDRKGGFHASREEANGQQRLL